MAFLTQRILASLWPHEPDYGSLDYREEPEPVILPATAESSGKPPVRIFLGTELAQYRAERVFIWSIKQVRDPSRRYEIYLMKELEGFNRRRWLTGFTNYRFAIPDFADRQGRAIYNDEDQIYLSDPALLFDLDMNGYGYLSVSDSDTSVMLLDCIRMAETWNLEAARTGRKNRLQGMALERGLRGPLDGGWNARDDEYRSGRSHLIHYTALHTQPWRPFPRLFAYQDSDEGKVWHDLEHSADTAGFQIFSAQRPSRNFRRLVQWLQGAGNSRVPDRPLPAWLEAELKPSFCKNHTAPLKVTLTGTGNGPSLPLSCYGDGEVDASKSDVVHCLDVLEYLPDEDIPWVVSELFSRARHSVTVTMQSSPRPLELASDRHLKARARPADWWQWIMEQAARRYPQLQWKLIVHDRSRAEPERIRVGGRLDHTPSVWVLYDHKPGHTTQTLGLADALGWPYESKALKFKWPAYLHRGIARLLGRLEATPFGLASCSLEALQPPWPDVIIAAGWRPTRIARWLVRHNRRSRAVLLGRKGATISAGDDILISCFHFRMPSHPRRIQTMIPPNSITPVKLAEAAAKWRPLFEGGSQPRIGVIVGGATELHHFDPADAEQLGRSVQSFADARGGSIFVITSRRTGAAATTALEQVLTDRSHIHRWRPGEPDNPYHGFLAIPDILVVTGDSESMIAEALSTGKPVYIYRLRSRRPGLRHRIAEWVVRRAHARPLNRRGTVRPQQGLEYLCARLLERNIVQPPRDLNAMYESLVSASAARYFDPADQDRSWQPTTRIDVNRETAEQVRTMLGISDG